MATAAQDAAGLARALGAAAPLVRLASFDWTDLRPHLSMDVEETDESFHVVADTPGLSRRQVRVTWSDNVLTIVAQYYRERLKEGERHFLQERQTGCLSRTVRLPRHTDPTQILAVLDRGSLHLVIPKKTRQMHSGVTVLEIPVK